MLYVGASSASRAVSMGTADLEARAGRSRRHRRKGPGSAGGLYTDIIAEVTDQHAVITNRNRDASMILPGECLLLVEMAPLVMLLQRGGAVKRKPHHDCWDDRRLAASSCRAR
jgi:hypothetical protein